jgi:branched-chain amino acid transport system substrate-binding protein
MRKIALFATAAAVLAAMPASADDLKIALIYGKTGPL